MNRSESMKVITEYLKNEIIVSANGFISRDLFSIKEKPTNFYMIGSMGLSSSIGLGIALKNPQKKIYVFDGDGNILMNLGSLVTIGSIQPKNLIHIIFDNGSHESTGGQPTSTNIIQIEKIAKAVHYKVFRTNNKKQLIKIMHDSKNFSGLIMILIKISKSTQIGKRISFSPIEIKKRFVNSLK
jgi:sulfopyruvate decarboxylase subunit beta